MCTYAHISAINWCIVGYLSDASWVLWDGSTITRLVARPPGWHMGVRCALKVWSVLYRIIVDFLITEQTTYYCIMCKIVIFAMQHSIQQLQELHTKLACRHHHRHRNVFRIKGPLSWTSTAHQWIPLQNGLVMWCFDIIFYVLLNKLSDGKWSCRWYEAAWCPYK